MLLHLRGSSNDKVAVWRWLSPEILPGKGRAYLGRQKVSYSLLADELSAAVIWDINTMFCQLICHFRGSKKSGSPVKTSSAEFARFFVHLRRSGDDDIPSGTPRNMQEGVSFAP